MTQRRQPIRSRAYLDGSRGQPCSLGITGICTGDAETVVAAHIRDETFGGAQKADDISVADACHACHSAFDGHGRAPLTTEEWLFYALRGLQRTLRSRVLRGLAVIPLDVSKPAHARPAKPRKPPEQRTKIAGRPMEKSTRPIPSRPMRQKEPTR